MDIVKVGLPYIINGYIATMAVNNEEALLGRFGRLC